jgi:hypothetical protein
VTHSEIVAALRSGVELHRDVYAVNRVVRGPNAQPTHSVESHPRVHAPGGEERGCDPCPPASTPTRPCPRCVRGTWTDSNRQPRRCGTCGGTGLVPAGATDDDLGGRAVPRRIPGTRRAS